MASSMNWFADRRLEGVQPAGWESIKNPVDREIARQEVLAQYVPNNPPPRQQIARDTIENARRNSLSPFLQQQAAEVQRPELPFQLGDRVFVIGDRTPYYVETIHTEYVYDRGLHIEYELRGLKNQGLTARYDAAMISSIDTTQESINMELTKGTRVRIPQNVTLDPDNSTFTEHFYLQHVQRQQIVGEIVNVDPVDTRWKYRVRFDGQPEGQAIWMLPQWVETELLPVGTLVQIDPVLHKAAYEEDRIPAHRQRWIDTKQIGRIVEVDPRDVKTPYSVIWAGDQAAPGSKFGDWIRAALVKADLTDLPVGTRVRVARQTSQERVFTSIDVPNQLGVVAALDGSRQGHYVLLDSGENRWLFREELLVEEPLKIDSYVTLTDEGLVQAVAQAPNQADFLKMVRERGYAGWVFETFQSDKPLSVCFQTSRGENHIHLNLGYRDVVKAPSNATKANGDVLPRYANGDEVLIKLPINLAVVNTKTVSQNDRNRLHQAIHERVVGEVLDFNGEVYSVGFDLGLYDEDGDEIETYWHFTEEELIRPSEEPQDAIDGTEALVAEVEAELKTVFGTEAVLKVYAEPDRTPEHQAAINVLREAVQAYVQQTDTGRVDQRIDAWDAVEDAHRKVSKAADRARGIV